MSPFRSKSQRRLFYAKLKRREITKAKIKEWESKTPKNIPERVRKKKTKKKKITKRTRKRSR